jgi:plastocyanin
MLLFIVPFVGLMHPMVIVRYKMKTKLLLISIFSIFAIVLSSCAAGAPAGGTSPTSAPSSSGGSNGTQVTISGFAFSPATLTIKVGTEVTWTNLDSVEHSVVSSSGNELNSPLIPQNGTYSHVFNTPGTYDYHCSIHLTMLGTIIITP